MLLSISRQAERDLELLPSANPQARIHMLRVRMKKLRAILRLMQPALAPSVVRALDGQLRVLKRATVLCAFVRSACGKPMLRKNNRLGDRQERPVLARSALSEGLGPSHPFAE
ncbi:MAG: hypothetical protein B7Z37_30345, partial [Verrucomicrobia bacterium 12-59-8]